VKTRIVLQILAIALTFTSAYAQEQFVGNYDLEYFANAAGCTSDPNPFCLPGGTRPPEVVGGISIFVPSFNGGTTDAPAGLYRITVKRHGPNGSGNLRAWAYGHGTGQDLGIIDGPVGTTIEFFKTDLGPLVLYAYNPSPNSVDDFRKWTSVTLTLVELCISVPVNFESLDDAGGDKTVVVTALLPECYWTAFSLNSWIELNGPFQDNVPGLFQGSAHVSYFTERNTTGASRIGIIHFSALPSPTMYVIQSNTGPPVSLLVDSQSDSQSGEVGEPLLSPLVVRPRLPNGSPASGVPISFSITQQPSGASFVY
jgi:hypothetical protein